MRTTIIVAAIMAAATAAPPAAAQVTRLQICTVMGDLAENVMRARQRGVSMSGLIAATTEGHAPESIEYSVVTQMIAAAYGQPRFSTDRNQARSVQDFRNDIESACFAGEE